MAGHASRLLRRRQREHAVAIELVVARRAREWLAVRQALMLVMIEHRAHRPRRCRARRQPFAREPEPVAAIASIERRHGATLGGMAAGCRTSDVTTRRTQALRCGAQAVAARAISAMFSVIERCAELGLIRRRAIGDEVAPGLGRVVACAADRRLAQAKICGMAFGANRVARVRDLTLGAQRMT